MMKIIPRRIYAVFFKRDGAFHRKIFFLEEFEWEELYKQMNEKKFIRIRNQIFSLDEFYRAISYLSVKMPSVASRQNFASELILYHANGAPEMDSVKSLDTEMQILKDENIASCHKISDELVERFSKSKENGEIFIPSPRKEGGEATWFWIMKNDDTVFDMEWVDE